MNPPLFPVPGPFNIILKHLWLLFLVTGVFNGWKQWRQLEPNIREDPERAGGYRGLFRWYLFWTHLPWVLMGIGIMAGKVSNIFEYLIPPAGNMWVLYWWAAIGLIMFAGTCWILLGRGAETLAAYPGLPMVPGLAPRQLRWAWFYLCLGELAVAVFLWSASRPAWITLDIIPYLFPFVFIGLWLMGMYITALLGGWRELSAKYALEGGFEGRIFTGSGQMGIMNYGGSLRIGGNQSGLYMGVVFLFRPGHPPLYIPWSDISCEAQKGFLFTRIIVRFAKASTVTLRLSRSLARKIYRSSENPNAFKGVQDLL